MLTTTIMKIWTLYLLVKTILYASLLPKRRLNNGTKSKHLNGHLGPDVFPSELNPEGVKQGERTLHLPIDMVTTRRSILN